MQFTPLKDFFSEEFRSQYCVGLSYTARDQVLMAQVEQWIEEGKVRIGAPDGPAGDAKVAGKGEVQTIGPDDVGVLKL